MCQLPVYCRRSCTSVAQHTTTRRHGSRVGVWTAPVWFAAECTAPARSAVDVEREAGCRLMSGPRRSCHQPPSPRLLAPRTHGCLGTPTAPTTVCRLWGEARARRRSVGVTSDAPPRQCRGSWHASHAQLALWRPHRIARGLCWTIASLLNHASCGWTCSVRGSIPRPKREQVLALVLVLVQAAIL